MEDSAGGLYPPTIILRLPEMGMQRLQQPQPERQHVTYNRLKLMLCLAPVSALLVGQVLPVLVLTQRLPPGRPLECQDRLKASRDHNPLLPA